jgi:hypothetical protein
MFFIKNMKRQTGISLLLASFFMTALSIGKENSGAGVVLKSVPSLVSDTLDISKFIRINKFYLEIIPPSSGVQFYHDGIVFLSNSKAEVNMPETHTSFGIVEAFFAVCKDTTIGNHAAFSASNPWEVPCDAMTFNSDYSVMYYTKWPGKKESEKIYQAKYQLIKNGKHEWLIDAKPLSFCSDNSVYTHPALSADGEKMVFSSNRSESYGGLDLFISYKEENGWSSPENLGNKINTKGNELYSFLDQYDNLFFSSDGIEGFGGYDIYFCRYNGHGWDKPVNLTKVINSENDDVAFKLSRPDGKSAFYTTRTKTGNKSSQLLRVTFRDQYSLNKLTNLSDAFKYIAQAGFSSAEAAIAKTASQVEAIKHDKEPVNEPVKTQKASEIIEEPVKLAAVKAPTSGDAVIYRVQFSASAKSKGSYEITVGGKKFKTYEYLYNGAYRSCAGEFSTSAQASNLQSMLKKGGYPDAFVVAFKNNVRFTGNIQSLEKSQEQPGQIPSSEATQTKKVTEIKQEPAKPPVQKQSALSDALVYRVQFSASMKPKGSYEITAGGKTYKTYEYLSNGAYCSCIGEFSTSTAAASLQKIMKQEGYPDAFVVAFKNNVRSTDPALFKK